MVERGSENPYLQEDLWHSSEYNPDDPKARLAEILQNGKDIKIGIVRTKGISTPDQIAIYTSGTTRTLLSTIAASPEIRVLSIAFRASKERLVDGPWLNEMVKQCHWKKIVRGKVMALVYQRKADFMQQTDQELGAQYFRDGAEAYLDGQKPLKQEEIIALIKSVANRELRKFRRKESLLSP